MKKILKNLKKEKSYGPAFQKGWVVPLTFPFILKKTWEIGVCWE